MEMNKTTAAYIIIIAFPNKPDDTVMGKLHGFLDEFFDDKLDFETVSEEIDAMTDDSKYDLFEDAVVWFGDNSDEEDQSLIFDFLLEELASEEGVKEEDDFMGYLISEWDFDSEAYIEDLQEMLDDSKDDED